MRKKISFNCYTAFTLSLALTFFSLLSNAQPSPPFSVKWINPLNANISGQILYKSQGGSAWNAGGISSNILTSNTDGWMEFAGSSGAHYIVGLAYNNVNEPSEFSYAIMLDHANNTCTVYEGNTTIGVGGWSAGDIFRIGRENNEVKYYRNGEAFRTVVVNPAVELKVKSVLRYIGKQTPIISSSFDYRLVLQGSVTGLETNNGMPGSIAVNVTGGTAPYAYSWSPDEQTATINNKPVGTYTVMVDDGAGRFQDRTYMLGYKINWIKTNGVSNNNNILTKTQSINTWGNGGVSSNILAANSDGWMEFTGAYGANYIIGLAVNDVIDFDKFTNAFHLDYTENIYRIYQGASPIGTGSWQPGDVFRISREQGYVKYYRNGVVVGDVATNSGNELKVKASIKYQGKSTPIINTSFEGNLVVLGSVTGLEGNTGSGSVALNVSGGVPPYTYSWAQGEQTSSVDEKQRGAYAVDVTDAVGRTKSRTYNIGYKVNWINQIGVSANNGILTKNTQARVWTNSGAVSSNVLASNTDGWIQFSADTGKDFLIGLATNNTIDFGAFQHAIFVDYLNNKYTIVEGPTVITSGSWQVGDVFKIAREGSTVSYYKNDVVIRSISVNPALPLKIKVTLQEPNKSSPNITASFWSSDGIVRTYYSIANGNWTTPSIWSLTENGPPSTVYPDDIDKVIIKGHEVIVDSNIKSAGIEITSVNDNTRLKVEGSMASLEVKGNIVMKRQNSFNTADVLVVNNNGRLEVLDH